MNDGRNVACVLVFAGLDPSGGAGIQADIQAISAYIHYARDIANKASSDSGALKK